MSNDTLIAQAGLSEKPRKSRLPARLDLVQSLSGFVLAIFMWGHMFFVATILLGKTNMDAVAKFFEGGYFLEKNHPGIVSAVVGAVIILIVVHAFLALRKFPINFRQFITFRAHAKEMRHSDTSLWMWQVYTGFAMFFLASAHLYQMLFFPGFISAEASGARVFTMPLFYLILLLAVELHGSIGLYRLAIKWFNLSGSRAFFKKLEKALLAFFMVLGLLTFGAYWKIGYDYVQQHGETFAPTYQNTGTTIPTGHEAN